MLALYLFGAAAFLLWLARLVDRAARANVEALLDATDQATMREATRRFTV